MGLRGISDAILVRVAPGYGFHQGYVWGRARTPGASGCDKQVAPRFYELVHEARRWISRRRSPGRDHWAQCAAASDYRDLSGRPSY